MDNEFQCYGIGFEEISELPSREGFKTISVTENRNWRNIIGKSIKDVVVYWEKVFQYKVDSATQTSNSTFVPDVWQIAFNNDVIWMASFEFREGYVDPIYLADHLTLFFDRRPVIHYKLLSTTDKGSVSKLQNS